MARKVLVVIDGTFRFAKNAVPSGSADFTYKVLTDALTAGGFEVTKANRGADSTATAGFAPFAFDALPAGHSLLEFDAIWLIGFQGRNSGNNSGSSTVGGIGASQINALAAYMEAGGGIFATGDHDSVGADMGGHLPRVRVMRSWFGANDPASAFPQPLPAELRNFSREDSGRADTVYRKVPGDTPAGSYPVFGDGHDDYVWFENQSDRYPQTITPTADGAGHPILRHNGADVAVYPDHMHEGNTLGTVGAAAYDYAAVNSPYGDTSKREFRSIAGAIEKPKVIATGQSTTHASRYSTDVTIPPALLAPEAISKPVNTLSAYDGRAAGVGRIVTGSTFHHYIDINLIGTIDVTNSALAEGRIGADGKQDEGFNQNTAARDAINAVFVNITNWIARPKPAISLILERSTFSQAEVGADPNFPAAVLVTVDGLKPTQFPGGGINALGNNPPGLAGWAPVITPAGSPIAFEPTRVDSDDPAHPDRIQRFTFTYRVHFTGPAFGFAGNTSTVPVSASLAASGVAAPLTDNAWLQLVKSANPFMLDLADNNDTTWLSSDVKVFHVVEGTSFHGQSLPMGADRNAALTFIHNLAGSISQATFSGLPPAEADSVLSSLPNTTSNPPRKVYNFALARVRLSNAGGNSDPVRVFFRIFTTQTTAALTYHLDGMGMPVEGYLRTGGADPIALPGTQNGGSDWLSFPFFAATRAATPAAQLDPTNHVPIVAATGFKIFGALVDNNLSGNYLPATPGGAGSVPLPTLMMGEHQCIVAQVEYPGTPIPNGATPWTSDKLSQRNLALSPVANPGLDASRVAFHTFEIEATPWLASETLPPDELLLDWSKDTPDGTVLRIHIPSWQAKDVVELADRFYPRHEIVAVDAHTIELPGGGTRYVPIPRSVLRQTGVIEAEYPLGIRKGQRFDVSVRQITNRSRQANLPRPKVREIPMAEAETLLAAANVTPGTGTAAKGAFTIGENKVLITDLRILDAAGDHAVLIEHPKASAVAAAMADAGQWREPIGAFQLGVPVSTRGDMLLHHMRLLSVMRWRTAQLCRNGRWYRTMVHYVGLLADKVQALGGNPWAVPATEDGAIPQMEGGGDGTGDGHGGGGYGTGGGDDLAEAIAVVIRRLFTPAGCAVLLILLLILLLLLWRLLH